MKPCFSKRKPLALLTLGELGEKEAQRLRAHVQTCAGCRGYLAEILAVGQNLAAAEPVSDLEASDRFHRALVRRLRAEKTAPVWASLAPRLPSLRLSYRIVLSGVAAAAALTLILAAFPPQRPMSPPVQTSRPVVQPPAPAAEVPPTLANYQHAALRSFEELDELLTRQASRNLPPAPTYTAAILALATTSE